MTSKIQKMADKCMDLAHECDVLLRRAEQAEQRLAVAMHGWDNAKAEVFRLADRLRAIDPEFQSGMHLNSSLAGQALTLLREARETLMTWLKTGEAHAVVQLQSKIDAFLGEV